MTTPAPHQSSSFQRWLLAALPALPLLVLLLPLTARLPAPRSPERTVALAYAALLLLPACFAPRPGLALIGAALNIALTLGLIAAGQRLRHSRELRFLLPGIVAVLLTALAYSYGPRQLVPLTDRLQHPYFSSISLGFTGTVALWLALLLPRPALPAWLRALTGLCALILLALSGSRGALLAACAGLVAASTQHAFTRWRGRQGPDHAAPPRGAALAAVLLGVLMVMLGGLLVGQRLSLFSDPVLSHLGSTSANGRDMTWGDTLDAIRAQPLSGYGPYLLGAQIAPAGQESVCQRWPALHPPGTPCPAGLDFLNGTWIIAHNAALQRLGESGPLGLLAHVLLCAYLLIHAWTARQPLLLALLAGLLTADLTDSVTMPPAQFFAALPWLAGGMALAQNRTPHREYTPEYSRESGHEDHSEPRLSALPWVALFLLTAWSFPIWANAISRSGALGHPAQRVTLHEVIAAPVWKGNDPYPILLVASAPAGQYRVQTRVCNAHGKACHTIASPPVQSKDSTPGITQAITIPAPAPGSSRLQVIVRPAQPSPLNTRPLAQYGWPVTRSNP